MTRLDNFLIQELLTEQHIEQHASSIAKQLAGKVANQVKKIQTIEDKKKKAAAVDQLKGMVRQALSSKDVHMQTVLKHISSEFWKSLKGTLSSNAGIGREIASVFSDAMKVAPKNAAAAGVADKGGKVKAGEEKLSKGKSTEEEPAEEGEEPERAAKKAKKETEGIGEKPEKDIKKAKKEPSGPEQKPAKKKKEVPPSDMKSNVSHIGDRLKASDLLRTHVKGKEIKQIYNDLSQQLIALDKAKPSEKKEKAEKIKNDFGLRVGSDGRLNVDVVGELHHDSKKLIGGGRVAKDIAEYFEDIGVPLKAEVGEEGKTKTLSTASKPNLGMTGLDAKDNKYVAEVFSEGPLAALEPGFKKLYVPTDGKGNPIDNKKGKNALEYLKHSVSNNKALDRTIEDAEKLVKAGKLKKEFVSELKAHKARMLEIVDNEKSIPSADAEKAVGNSYAALAGKLSEIDKDSAESVMKNFAEMALYDTEIARGKEVYLPAAGNFPSGDKLKITRKGTKIEKIQSVSIKYGKKGEFSSYGFPGEASKYCLYHKDPKKRELLKSRPGETGYTIGVKDSMIDDRKEFDAVLKKSGGIDKAIKNMDKFYKLVKEYKEATAEAIAKKGVLAASESTREKLDRMYTKRMRDLVDYEKLSDVIGYDNARTVLGLPAKKGEPDTLSGPNCFMSAATFSHILQTSNGLEMLEHNHQEYVDGEYHSETNTYEDGTINLKL